MAAPQQQPTLPLEPAAAGAATAASPGAATTAATTAAAGAATGAAATVDHVTLHQRVVAALKTCYDPEIPVDIWELGLIYDVSVDDHNFVTVTMTLTSPACPVAGSLPPEVEQKVGAVEGCSGALVELTWEPPWDPSRMTEEAKLTLGF